MNRLPSQSYPDSSLGGVTLLVLSCSPCQFGHNRARHCAMEICPSKVQVVHVIMFGKASNNNFLEGATSILSCLLEVTFLDRIPPLSAIRVILRSIEKSLMKETVARTPVCAVS